MNREQILEELYKYIDQKYENPEKIKEQLDKMSNEELDEYKRAFDNQKEHEKEKKHPDYNKNKELEFGKFDHYLQKLISPENDTDPWKDVLEEERKKGKDAPIKEDNIPDNEKLRFNDKEIEDSFHKKYIEKRKNFNDPQVRDAIRLLHELLQKGQENKDKEGEPSTTFIKNHKKGFSVA